MTDDHNDTADQPINPFELQPPADLDLEGSEEGDEQAFESKVADAVAFFEAAFDAEEKESA